MASSTRAWPWLWCRMCFQVVGCFFLYDGDSARSVKFTAWIGAAIMGENGCDMFSVIVDLSKSKFEPYTTAPPEHEKFVVSKRLTLDKVPPRNPQSFIIFRLRVQWSLVIQTSLPPWLGGDVAHMYGTIWLVIYLKICPVHFFRLSLEKCTVHILRYPWYIKGKCTCTFFRYQKFKPQNVHGTFWGPT